MKSVLYLTLLSAAVSSVYAAPKGKEASKESSKDKSKAPQEVKVPTQNPLIFGTSVVEIANFYKNEKLPEPAAAAPAQVSDQGKDKQGKDKKEKDKKGKDAKGKEKGSSPAVAYSDPANKSGRDSKCPATLSGTDFRLQHAIARQVGDEKSQKKGTALTPIGSTTDVKELTFLFQLHPVGNFGVSCGYIQVTAAAAKEKKEKKGKKEKEDKKDKKTSADKAPGFSWQAKYMGTLTAAEKNVQSKTPVGPVSNIKNLLKFDLGDAITKSTTQDKSFKTIEIVLEGGAAAGGSPAWKAVDSAGKAMVITGIPATAPGKVVPATPSTQIPDSSNESEEPSDKSSSNPSESSGEDAEQRETEDDPVEGSEDSPEEESENFAPEGSDETVEDNEF